MISRLAVPHFEGSASRQAHADIPANTFEREAGREGFYGAATHFYHRNPPTAWTSINGPLRPRAFEPLANIVTASCPFDTEPIASNASVSIRVARIQADMNHLVRNADGDQLIFVHAGSADWFSDYGHLQVSTGDYIVIPRGCSWRFAGAGELDLLMVEATGGGYALPERGLVGRHAPFDPGVLDIPKIDEVFSSQDPRRHWKLVVKRANEYSELNYSYDPLDVIGWKGDLYPVRLNVKDIRAVVSDRLHLPPSVRTTFVAPRFVVCSLIPRPLETDPGAMKLPFFHSNDDFDEVIFQHSGKHGSRGAGIGAGCMTYHPSGLIHGPHPSVLPHMFNHPASYVSSYSVMIDTRDPLVVSKLAGACEMADYANSWKDSVKFAPDANELSRGQP